MEEEEKWNENEGVSVPVLKVASITGACACGVRSRRE